MCWVCGENLQAQPYMFRNVVMSDGLSGLLVNAIYKDSEGFIWLGTDNGLDRFDGVKVKHFEFRGVDSGRKKRVNCITETDNKQLWIGLYLKQLTVFLNKQSSLRTYIKYISICQQSIDGTVDLLGNDSLQFTTGAIQPPESDSISDP